MTKKKQNPEDKKVFLPKMISVDLLFPHPFNPQKHSKHTFNELRESIRTQGFDESLTIYPRTDDIGYWIVSGNHRYLAGKAEGYLELPCVIRDDWTAAQADIEVVRRNYVRGRLDNTKFSELVDHIADKYSMDFELIIEEMGFETADDFAQFYEKEREVAAQVASSVAASTSKEVALIDNLGAILSDIFEKYGQTVPNSFIIFPLGGKKHMYVIVNSQLRSCVEEVTTYAVKNGMNINVVLAGLLRMGLKQASLDGYKSVEALGASENVDL